MLLRAFKFTGGTLEYIKTYIRGTATFLVAIVDLTEIEILL
jgi:hypothetical protein